MKKKQNTGSVDSPVDRHAQMYTSGNNTVDQQRAAQAIWLHGRLPGRLHVAHAEVSRLPREYCIGVAATAFVTPQFFNTLIYALIFN